jgi:NADH-quinone oxidoreductase subunit G
MKTKLRFTTKLSSRIGAQQENSENFSLTFTDLTFGTEELSAHSECLEELEPEPAVIMQTSEANSMGLVDGDLISIQTESGDIKAKLKAVENMATGVLVIPRHRKLTWKIFGTGTISIGREQIKKAVA